MSYLSIFTNKKYEKESIRIPEIPNIKFYVYSQIQILVPDLAISEMLSNYYLFDNSLLPQLLDDALKKASDAWKQLI